jgi:hypothetical protein
MSFSFWDFLFGTAVNAEEGCTVSGVTGLAMPETILGQFIVPFRMLYVQVLRAAGRAPSTLSTLSEN